MNTLSSQIESLLFVSAKALSLKNIAEVVKAPLEEVEYAAEELVERYKGAVSGVQIIRHAQSLQMVSAPENAKVIQEFIKDETTGELSRPSLETLTIIAYRGPIAKLDIDRIRGVNCSLILRNLMLRGLIEGKVKKETQETYYSVTIDFIRFLGLNDVAELPDYDRLHQDDTIDRVLAGAEPNL
ncbi:MAG: SMC-Scp complex subunit ScpB [Candidatus Falkowbacteria bacterium]